MKAPAFSLDYFPSREVAWSLFKDPKVVLSSPMTPMGLRPTGSWEYFDNRIGTYGSAGSSNGPWVGDVMPSGPQTPYSTGNTPPIFLNHRSHRNSSVNSLSTSPEQQQQSHRTTRRSNSNLSAALSSLSRPFTIMSSSPSANDRFRTDGDLSLSAPATATAITWGSTTFYSGSSTISPEKRRRSYTKRNSFATHGSTYSSTDESDLDYSDYSDDELSIRPVVKQPNAPEIKVMLKNQHLFDDEAHASIPLLPPEHAAKYAAYRELYADLLSTWGLYIQRAEILKFNGLTNYWPTKMSSQQLLQQIGPASNTLPAGTSSGSIAMSNDLLGSGNVFPPPITDEKEMIKREVQFRAIKNMDANALGWYDSFTEAVKNRNLMVPMDEMHRRNEQLLRNAEARNKMLEHPDILRQAQRPGEQPLDTTERLRTSCRECKEVIKGIYFTCPSGIHRVHLECHGTPDRKEYLATGRARPIGCECPTPPGYINVSDSNKQDLL
jgi:hypothetical protein